MKKEAPASGIVVVQVGMTDDLVKGKPAVQLWAAALPRDEAVAAVKRRIPAHWTAELTDHHLSIERVQRLRMRPGDVRELTDTQ